MTQILEFDRPAFAAAFGKTPFPVRHRLADHPLLTVEAIARLADALPEASVEHNLGSVDAVLPSGEAPRLDLSPGEIARGIDSNGCWMVLKNIEQVAEYRELLESSLAEVTPGVAEREGGVRRREGFVFLSAPNSVTPSHFDEEHNLLLQIRGSKEFNVGRYPDPHTEQLELERLYGGGHRNIDWLPQEPRTFDLQPGDGVTVPIHAPHWVRNGPEVSVSFSITFKTAVTERNKHVHAVNARLRRLRLSPSPPGRRPLADRAKASVTGARRTARRLAGRG